MNNEKFIRHCLKELSKHRVSLVLKPGNVWVVENLNAPDDETEAALNTAWMRGWVEPLHNAIPHGYLGPNNELPQGELFQSVINTWRLTEGGWAVINQITTWVKIGVILSAIGAVAAILSLVILYI